MEKINVGQRTKSLTIAISPKMRYQNPRFTKMPLSSGLQTTNCCNLGKQRFRCGSCWLRLDSQKELSPFSCVAKGCSEVNCRDSPDKLRSCGLEIARASTIKKRFPECGASHQHRFQKFDLQTYPVEENRAATGDVRPLKCAPHYFGPAILSQVALLKKTTMKGPGTKVKATKFQHKGRVRATKEKHRGTSGHWYRQNVENHHEYTWNILELNIMNLKYLFINTSCLGYKMVAGVYCAHGNQANPKIDFYHLLPTSHSG